MENACVAREDNQGYWRSWALQIQRGKKGSQLKNIWGQEEVKSRVPLTAAYDQSKSSVTIFILPQAGEALTSNPGFGDEIFFVA